MLELLLELIKMYGAGVGIVVWVLYTNYKREERYIQIIEKFAKNYEVIKRDISDIKKKVYESGDKDE